jgi:hypothetical protein
MALPLLLFALLSGQDAVSTVAPEVAAPQTQTPPAQAEYTPEGAPRDDYNFTAWCHGVLSGHMALAERVQPVLPLDEVQQKIGKAYLKGYEEALAVGRRGRSAAEIDAADAIRYAARANWNTAMKADLQLGADTYLAWQLPGRCEHAAIRVAGRPNLFRMAPTQAEVESMGVGVAGASEVAEASPPPVTAPEPTAVAAPVPAAAPIEETVVPVFTSAFLPPADPVTEDDPAADAFAAAADPEAPAAGEVPDEPPAETLVAEAAPADQPAADEPAPETRPANDGRIITMPRKGRLFPWGKRE